MENIDYIFNLLDWNNSLEVQNRGVELAREIKNLAIFLQPPAPYGKRVWDNCARILCSKSDEELSPYLIKLLEWLQDMNWPGAFTVLERLKFFLDKVSFNAALEFCKKKAFLLNDEIWAQNLELFSNYQLDLGMQNENL